MASIFLTRPVLAKKKGAQCSGSENIRNQNDQLGEREEGYKSSFEVKGRMKDREKKAQIVVTKANGLGEEDGALCSANTKHTAISSFHIVHGAFTDGQISSIKAPSKPGK